MGRGGGISKGNVGIGGGGEAVAEVGGTEKETGREELEECGERAQEEESGEEEFELSSTVPDDSNKHSPLLVIFFFSSAAITYHHRQNIYGERTKFQMTCSRQCF